MAEDILQEAFVRSLDRVDSIRNPGWAVAWFYRVLRNAIADHFRRQEVRDRALVQVSAEAGDQATAADEELEAVVCACVMGLVDTLKPEYAAAVRRVDLDGMSVRGYAEESGITPGNAGVRLHRAREACADSLPVPEGRVSPTGASIVSAGIRPILKVESKPRSRDQEAPMAATSRIGYRHRER